MKQAESETVTASELFHRAATALVRFACDRPSPAKRADAEAAIHALERYLEAGPTCRCQTERTEGSLLGISSHFPASGEASGAVRGTDSVPNAGTCAQCRAVFSKKRDWQLFCGPRCAHRARYLRRKAKAAPGDAR